MPRGEYYGAAHHRCPCGGIGRRAGFKIPFSQGSVGSIPTGGTTTSFAEVRKTPKVKRHESPYNSGNVLQSLLDVAFFWMETPSL